jgi:catechol 2,3-dioxygenase-like lactoylglutathione lyase family enzyme
MSTNGEHAALKEWEVSHICLAVDDLDTWVERYSAMLGTRWSSLVVIDDEWITASGERELIQGRGAWASGQSPWLELFEGALGSPWEIAPGQARLDHIGYWADDMDACAAQLVASGHVLEYAMHPPENGLVGFAYYRHPTGIRVEIHEGRDREAFKRWVDHGEPLVVDWGVEAP